MSRRTATRPEVRVGGFWLSSIVPQGWGELEHGTRINGGWQASWSIPIVDNWRHPALVYGALVEIMLGPIVIWSGTLEEPDWDEGLFVAIGACRDGETAQALDGSGDSSTVPNVVIDAAIARGALSWTRLDDFGATPVGDATGTGGLVTVQWVLDAWAEQNDSRWKVNAQRQLVIEPIAEDDPKWFIVPGASVLGSSAENRVDVAFVRYIDSGTSTRETAQYPAVTPVGGIEKGYPIVDRGPMTNAAATAIAQSIWSQLKGRSGWTNGVRLSRGQAFTKGSVIADLALIEAGDAVRFLGQSDPRGIALNLDVVIGETDYDWTDDEVQANPVGMAARDEEAVLELALTRAREAMEMAGAAMTVS